MFYQSIVIDISEHNYYLFLQVCYEYMDKHAIEVINHESFFQLSPTALNELVSRDSFYAPEIDIFRAVQSWVKANSDVDPNLVLSSLKNRITFIIYK